MAKTEVILLQNVVGLGAESDQVKVAAGYARNFLLPQGLAIPLTQANKRRLEALRQRRAEREAHELQTMTELARSVRNFPPLVVKVKTGEDGKMFGAVTTGAIADELKRQFDVALDKKKIHIEKPIRALGDYEVDLHLHPEVHATLKIKVESLTPIIAPETAPAAAAKGEEKPGDKAAAKGERAERKPRAARTAKAE
jgi:large subunit ribosomal protein L9